MKLSTRGKNLIKSHEGLVLAVYPDPATGGAPYTVMPEATLSRE